MTRGPHKSAQGYAARFSARATELTVFSARSSSQFAWVRSSMSQAARFASPGDAEVPILVHSTTSQPTLGSGILGHATRTAPESLWSDKSFGHPQTSVAATPALDQGTAADAYGA